MSSDDPDYVAFHFLRGVDLPPAATTAIQLRDGIATLFETYPDADGSTEKRIEFLEAVYPLVVYAVFDLDRRLAGGIPGGH